MEYTAKKEIAKQFLLLIAQGEVCKAFSNYISHNFRHHYSMCKGQAEDLKELMEQKTIKYPQQTIKIMRLIEQSDLVMAHCLVKNNEEDLGTVAVYIFRFENHLISELWDVQQKISENCINTNGVV